MSYKEKRAEKAASSSSSSSSPASSKSKSRERQETPRGLTLREKAARKLHGDKNGEGANPSMLGDPISIKAETSETTEGGEVERASESSERSMGSEKSEGSRAPLLQQGGQDNERARKGDTIAVTTGKLTPTEGDMDEEKGSKSKL